MAVDPLTYISAYPGRFPIWHVKDMARQDPTANTEIGTGSINYKRLFAHVQQAGLRDGLAEPTHQFQR